MGRPFFFFPNESTRQWILIISVSLKTVFTTLEVSHLSYFSELSRRRATFDESCKSFPVTFEYFEFLKFDFLFFTKIQDHRPSFFFHFFNFEIISLCGREMFVIMGPVQIRHSLNSLPEWMKWFCVSFEYFGRALTALSSAPIANWLSMQLNDTVA